MIRWIPFGVAKPLLDKRKYVVLSDYVGENGLPLLSSNSEDAKEHEPEYSEYNDSNNLMIEAGQSVGSENEDSDDDLELEINELGPVEIEDGDIGNIVIGLEGSHTMRYKVCIYRITCSELINLD